MLNTDLTNFLSALFLKMMEKEDHSKLLLELNNILINKYSPEAFSDALATAIQNKVTKYDRFSITVVDPLNTSVSYFHNPYGIKIPEIDYNKRDIRKASLSQYVIKNKKTLTIHNLAEYSQWPSVPYMIKQGLRSVISIPLIHREKAFGSMHIYFKNIPINIDKLASFLEFLSMQIALLVDNIIMHIKANEQVDILNKQNIYLQEQNEEMYDVKKFFFASPKMRSILDFVNKVASLDVPILITGETGTGKDFLARIIHYYSLRKNKVFVKINCPAIPRNLFESELFGYSKGAFTNATSQKVGRIELANNGTLFLDEISDIPIDMQSKLLQVLQEKVISRIGDNKIIKVNFRLITATNANLEEKIRKNEFRSDLYYRINIFNINIPPLRDRLDDIPILLENILTEYARTFNCKPPRLTNSAVKLLQEYNWPGNVRELQSFSAKVIVLYSGKMLLPGDIKNFFNNSQNFEKENNNRIEELEKNFILDTLEKNHYNISKTARSLNIPRTTLQYKINKYRTLLNK